MMLKFKPRKGGHLILQGGVAAPPESQGGGAEGGKPKALSQPVDPGGVGGSADIF